MTAQSTRHAADLANDAAAATATLFTNLASGARRL